jgi:hypothetical protein
MPQKYVQSVTFPASENLPKSNVLSEIGEPWVEKYYFMGVKAAGALGCQTCHLLMPAVSKFREPRTPGALGADQACNGITLLVPTTIKFTRTRFVPARVRSCVQTDAQSDLIIVLQGC